MRPALVESANLVCHGWCGRPNDQITWFRIARHVEMAHCTYVLVRHSFHRGQCLSDDAVPSNPRDGYSNKQPFLTQVCLSSVQWAQNGQFWGQTVTDNKISLVLREAAMAAAQRSFQKTRVQDYRDAYIAIANKRRRAIVARPKAPFSKGQRSQNGTLDGQI